MTDVMMPTSSEQGAKQDKMFEHVVGSPGDKNCKYEKVRVLGSGSFGEAWLVKRVADGQLLVAKRMDLSQMSAKDQKYVEAEIQCLASCSHFAIIKYMEDFTEDNFMLIIMEYADAGDLNMQIKQRAAEGYRYFEEHEVGYTFVQLAMSVDHIHRRRMLHRDIKGANVMLMTNGLIKLGDFGFSHQYEDSVSDQVASTFCGTPYYLAPELWRRQRYSKKADVWAMGILLYEMMALKRPFMGQGMRALMECVLSGNIPPLPTKFSSDLRAVCLAMLNPDPNQRPSIAELFAMPQMVKLLRDFEKSAQASPLINDELKKQIQDNINEIRETKADDSSTTHVGHVGDVQTAVQYEGNVRKESSKQWKDRYLQLRDGNLVISIKKGDKEAKPLPVTCVASVVPIPFHAAKLDGVFAINTTDQKTMWMQAPSRAVAYEWIHKIQQAMGVA
ncbi:serine-threonine protein kinase, putative [Bodo saltans]|uniref:non-specific serine/threonine protein kinase n=1 Tax=Bodo saltans TaxID=75058 RepID=A0A0S4IMB7_BODSA|nr:serine-threonine protein kinase, putative [Bodo saltans]|eukprot:CUE73253.1 serine-threonine protein kinase, putative [Bodo saltans]